MYVCMYVLTSCTVHLSKKLQQSGKSVARGGSIIISYKQVIIKLFIKINVSCVKEHELHCSVM